jgi:peptidyl-prolyl cis-trans isomerase C
MEILMRKIGLLLACSLLVACAAGDDEDRSAAKSDVLQFNTGEPGLIIDGKPISRELLAAIARGRGTSLDNPEQRDQALRELLDYVLLAQAARREGASTDMQFNADVEVARLQGVANAYLSHYRRLHPVTDEQVKAEYDAQIAKAGNTTYDFSQLLFKSEADATVAAAELAKGKPFAAVYDAWRDKAQQAKAFKGVRLSQLPVPELVQALQSLKAGEATKQPVKSSFGWHIIGVTATAPYTPPPLDSIKGELRQLLERKQTDAYVAGLRDQSAVQEVGKADKPAAPSPQ